MGPLVSLGLFPLAVWGRPASSCCPGSLYGGAVVLASGVVGAASVSLVGAQGQQDALRFAHEHAWVLP
jgi:hypothetical protein